VLRARRLRHRPVWTILKLLSPSEYFEATKVSGLLGYLHPGMALTISPIILPCRSSSHCPCSKTRLLERSSPEVQPSFMVCTRKHPSCSSRLRTTLLGFLSPTAYTDNRSPRPPPRGQLSDPIQGPNQYPPAVPTPLATVPLSGFLNLSATLFLLLPPYRFQAGNAHGVRPPGIYSFREAFSNSSPLKCPLAVPPASCAALVPRPKLL
jgi:hypothetical protein